MGYISVRNAHKEFMKDGEPLTILEDINLDIEKGEFICLLGPSGSGKSTLLNAMAGFELVTSGSIIIDGEEVKAPQLRYVTVFQNYGLLPWRTVESNIELGLESKKVPKEERPAIIDKYVKMVGLDHARNRYPAVRCPRCINTYQLTRRNLSHLPRRRQNCCICYPRY